MKIILLGLAFVSCQPTLAQSPSRENFTRDYLSHEETLFNKFCFNRIISYTLTHYNLTGVTTELRSRVEATGITSTNSRRSRGTITTGSSTTPEPLGELATAGTTYLLGRGDAADRFAIMTHRAVYISNDLHPGFGSSQLSCYPLAYEDAVYTDLFGTVLRRQSSDIYIGKIPRLESLKLAQLDGRQVISAEFKSPFNVNSTIYLDPANDYAYLGFDSDGSLDHKTRIRGPVKISGRLTYRQSKEGHLLPVKSETWYILPNGKRLTQSLVEITSNEKYTPAPDDFDLEKQFGVKPLPPPGTSVAGPHGRSWWWLYAVAAALALVTAGLVVAARRRRAA